VTCDDSYQLGSTPVNISKENASNDDTEASSALVLCGSELRRVTMHPNPVTVDYTVSALWVTNRADVSSP
jgi:hypothetical protein